MSIAMVALPAECAAAAPGFVYALNQVTGGANQIYGFQLDPGSGALTLLPGFPVAGGGVRGGGAFSEHVFYRTAVC